MLLVGKNEKGNPRKKYFYFFQNAHTLLAKACIYKHVPTQKDVGTLLKNPPFVFVV